MDAAGFIREATQGDVDTARAALQADPSLARARNGAGVSVIAGLVYVGRADFAREVAAMRADLDIFEASCVGDVAAVGELLKQDPASLNATSPDGFGPLGYAAYFGHAALLRTLLAAGAEADTASRNPMRVRPLHSAAAHSEQRHAAALAEPLLRAGADPNAKQQAGFAPLHEAVLNDNLQLVELLLDHGADPALRNDAGESPISLARERGSAALLSRLEAAASG